MIKVIDSQASDIIQPSTGSEVKARLDVVDEKSIDGESIEIMKGSTCGNEN